jgi:hypothetical protein
MLVERDVQVINIDVIGQAYAIAADYLYRSGALADPYHTDQSLLEIIVDLFEVGDRNRIRIANRAIRRYQAAHPQAGHGG